MLSTPLRDLLAAYSQVCLVAHDAGAAQIFRFFPSVPSLKLNFFVEGPAKQILGDVKGFNLVNESQALSSDLVITGTSANSNLEREIIEKRKLLDKEVWSYLDHWVNYQERFFLKNKLVLPNKILVGDVYALKIALGVFPKETLVYTDNPLFEFVSSQTADVANKQEAITVLYLWEPNITFVELNGNIVDDVGIFELFLAKFEMRYPSAKYLIRAHPAQPLPMKIRELASASMRISISNEKDFLVDFKKVAIVAGYETMGLVLANMMGKKVYSSKPKEGGVLTGAFEGITQI